MAYSTYNEFSEQFPPLMKRIRSGTIDVGRTHYAVSLGLATAQALCMGLEEVTAMEFGVASGKGLFDICKAADFLHRETGMRYRVFGFDNCTGLMEPRGYVDHPEIWSKGDSTMHNKSELLSKLPPYAKLIEGDIAQTVPGFLKQNTFTHSPIGFIAIDVDYYYSTLDSFKILEGEAKSYLPATIMYFDDMNGLLTYNSYCGEARAIKEFNMANDLRKIEANPHSGFPNFHCCHFFDHPVRMGTESVRWAFEIGVGW